jgi:hypothetical protein
LANRSLGRASLIAKVIAETGNEITSPWVLGPIEADRPERLDVFQRDKSGAESCDILVADVSEPSVGVGMEIMAVHKAGKKIILVVRRGNITSRMLMHMQPKEVVEYDDDSSLVRGLERALRRLSV